MNMRLMALLDKIDHNDDQFWNTDGTPILDKVKTLWGLGKLTQSQLDQCGLVRQTVIEKPVVVVQNNKPTFQDCYQQYVKEAYHGPTGNQ